MRFLFVPTSLSRRSPNREEDTGMASQVAQKMTDPSFPRGDITVQAEDWFYCLVKLIAANTELFRTRNLKRTPHIIEESLFEIQIDGARYTLMRSQPLSIAHAPLSPRELTIARLIAKGLPNKSISDILEISPWTVATHLRRIFVKLDVTSRAAMVARLSEQDLL
jgi:DNA-binding CsgD family transcriptional regulator